MNQNKLNSCVGLIALVALTACNGGTSAKQFLKNVSLSVSQQGNDSYLNLNSNFDLGNVSLAEMTVAIMDPRSHEERGAVHFGMLQNGQAEITLSANASLMANADSVLGQSLPNRKPLPMLLNIPTGEMLGLKILEHSVVYLGGDTRNVAYAGVALGVKGLDQVMNQVMSPVNIFYGQNFGPSIFAVGGLYGSNLPEESGIAIFGKYTKPGIVSKSSIQEEDTAVDAEISRLNARTILKLHRFFKGKKRTLEIY